MVNGPLLTYKAKLAEITLLQLAAELNISPMALYNKLHNKSEFRANEIARCSRMLGLSAADVDSIFFGGKVILNQHSGEGNQ